MARLAFAGRVVTMDDAFTVHDDGVVYVEDDLIAATLARRAPPPPGFEDVRPLETLGTVYPGLIELHNHLSYNVLRLWKLAKRFTNRDQWAQGDEYRKLVTGPMKVLAHTPSCVPAVVRYVEAKCLCGGTTTSQGIALSSYAGIMRFYRGIVRNVEQTGNPDLPEALTHIADVEATDRAKFLDRLRHSSCLLLHLSEGTDEAAREHFLALHGDGAEWAITPALAGIHCVALEQPDFQALVENGGSMVWSPLSNLLLYGGTADVKAAKAAGAEIGLGPDWSPSGSKNLLGELKVARAVSASLGGVFSDRELVGFATRDAAAIVKWSHKVGSLEPGKLADLLVIDGSAGDPYEQLLRAREHEIHLVVIGGVPRYGLPSMVEAALTDGDGGTERIRVAGRVRSFNLQDPAGDPVVASMSLSSAIGILKDALARLPELAKNLDRVSLLARLNTPPDAADQPVFLVLDHEDLHGVDLRPRLPTPDGRPQPGPPPVATATPLQDLLVPLELDPLTAQGDEEFIQALVGEENLPPELREELGPLLA